MNEEKREGLKHLLKCIDDLFRAYEADEKRLDLALGNIISDCLDQEQLKRNTRIVLQNGEKVLCYDDTQILIDIFPVDCASCYVSFEELEAISKALGGCPLWVHPSPDTVRIELFLDNLMKALGIGRDPEQ